MPIYEYACAACDHKFETLQRMSDDPLSECPQCGRHELKKLISAAGFRLKGGGWYETDFKGDKGRRNLAESDSSRGGDQGGKEKGEGGGKPAAGEGGKSATPPASASSTTAAPANPKPAGKPASG